ncbi:MAG: inositol monophosphatase family protein [Sedimenticola sp.]|nr:inositol monophosphatase family protein [Sedimenticola sp.]
MSKKAALPDSQQLQHLIIEIAEAEVMSRYRHPDISRKRDGTLVTDADLAVQAELTEKLAEAWPDIRMMGEEMTAAEQQAASESDCYWCVDPLDGTTNYSSGLPYFALSLALIVEGRAVLGIVYDPVRHECFRAELDRGAWLNDGPLKLEEGPGTLKECIAIVDLKRLTPTLVTRLANETPYRSQRCFGAIALEWCWLAAGRAHLNLHGGQKLWDYAAGRLIFSEAGGVYSNQPVSSDNRLGLQVEPALGAVDQHLFELWQQWLNESDFPISQ